MRKLNNNYRNKNTTIVGFNNTLGFNSSLSSNSLYFNNLSYNFITTRFYSSFYSFKALSEYRKQKAYFFSSGLFVLDTYKTRNFSSTKILFVKDQITGHHKIELRSLSRTFDLKYPIPTLNEKDKILSERAVHIAAAYKNDPEGLDERIKEVKARFHNISKVYDDYFREKYSNVTKSFNEERLLKNLDIFSSNACIEYLKTTQFNQVQKIQVTGEDQILTSLSTDAYRVYKKSMSEHLSAKSLLENKGLSSSKRNFKYINEHGIADRIDKNLFKSDFTCTYPKFEESNMESPTKIRFENSVEKGSLKKSIEQAEAGSSKNNNHKDNKIDKASLDYLLNKDENPKDDKGLLQYKGKGKNKEILDPYIGKSLFLDDRIDIKIL
jgi:hypothetical protein